MNGDIRQPLLVFGYGNPGRGDDGLGPAFVERVQAADLPGVACLTDFQLQPEHALDLLGRARVLFVDASLTGASPFDLTRVTACRDESFSSHAMSPAAVLHALAAFGAPAPGQVNLLAIRGQRFELGEALSPAAGENLNAAFDWFRVDYYPAAA